MLDSSRLVQLSKYLSYHLRHCPEALGLELEPGGWVRVDALLAAARSQGCAIEAAELADVVARSDKQRFSFDASGARIRANQGRSVAVDLQLEPALPPDWLYHGTAARHVASIQASGLQKMQRHHVHLTGDRHLAHRVGQRHGQPALFRIAAARQHADGYTFFCSVNGVWLVDSVPPRYLELLDS